MNCRLNRSISFLVALIVVTGGCIPFSIPVGYPEPEEFVDDQMLESWLDTSEAYIQEQLGPPNWGLQDGEIRYYVYEGLGVAENIDMLTVIWLPVPIDKHKSFHPWCLRLTFNPSFSSFEKLMKPEIAADCRTAFWWPRSINLMEAAWKETRAAKLKESAETGDRAASLALASEFDDSSYLEALASDGDKEVALILAKDFDEPAFLRVLAEAGDDWAEFELAKLGGGERTMETLAKKGNLLAAFELYKQLSLERQTTPEAWEFLCVAANGGNGEAQAELGYWHRSRVWKAFGRRRKHELQEARIVPSDTVAYMWYTLAIRNGDEYAAGNREFVRQELTPDETVQAEQMARDWKPGDCPSKEHRLEPPGET